MARLAGKAAVVTGGTRGIGLAIVRAFLAEGASVLYSGASAATVEQAGAALPEGAPARGLVADLADPEAPQQTVDATLAAFGRLDILVANAGVIDTAGPWDVTPEQWDRVATVNLRAVFEDIGYQQGTADVTSEVQRLVALQPDVVFHASYDAEAILYARTYKQYGFNPKGILAIGAAFGSSAFRDAMGEDANGFLVREHWARDLESQKPVIAQVGELYR